MGSAAVRTGLDTCASSASPTVNYAASKGMTVSSTSRYGYLYVANPVPAGATVLSATLYLYGMGTGWPSMTVSVQRIAAAWRATTLNWNNKPAVTGATATRVQANATDATEWAIDVTVLVQAIADGAANYGMRLASNNATARAFYSFESGHPPVLAVTWSDAPDAPTTLAPSGNRAVATDKPTLRFDYTDVSGDVTLAAVQVQIDPGNDFATPDWDSNSVATPVPQLDLSTTDYPGLADTASTYWRVRVQDGAGLWSAWSDAAQFRRADKAALTIDAPAASPNNTVTDWTPPILWTFAGTQTAFRVVVLRTDVEGFFLQARHDSGRQQSTATSYTIPDGVLDAWDGVYTLSLSVWDDVDREATPGDPPWIVATREFTVTDDPTPDPVSNLVAQADPSGLPFVLLTWERATPPDAYAIMRDGLLVATNISPGDLLDSGTDYSYTDRSAPLNAEHTWMVQCIVNGAVAADSPEVDYTVPGREIWLVEPVSETYVAIVGAYSTSFAMPDLAANYEPVGSDHIVRITQAQRGLEGTISGRLGEHGTTTAASQLTAMTYLKTHPDVEVTLLIGNQALRCLLGDITLAPLPGPVSVVDDRQVSFAFWSLEGL